MKINGLSYDRWFYINAVRPCKHFWQRLTRGFDDSETWSLDSSLATHILPRLKRFREYHRGYPMSMTAESWNAVLDKMIFAFEYHCDEERKYGRNAPGEYEKVEEGLKLFAEYYGNLWW